MHQTLMATAGNTIPRKSFSIPRVALAGTEGKKLPIRRPRRSPPTEQGGILGPLLRSTHAKYASRGKRRTKVN